MDQPESDKRSLLKRAVQRVLAPLVRLLINNGVTYREFCDLTKDVYFENGVSILNNQSKKITESQLALLTGLHRKDVSVFMKQAESGQTKPVREHPSFCAAIIADWISNPRYTDKHGEPQTLAYQDNDEAPSFTALVTSASTDVRPRAVLEEMIRLELVTEDTETKTITLQKNAFVPTQDFAEKIRFLDRNVGDHMAAAIANIDGQEPPFFERSAFHTRLSMGDIALLQKIIHKDGMGFLKKIYAQADSLSEENISTTPQDKNLRMTCGVYFYAENTKTKTGDPDEVQ